MSEHKMIFRNYGGIHQFVVKNAADLAQIDALDPAHWAAMSAPLCDLNADAVFLNHVDTSGHGRIRIAHLIAARDWLFERLSGRSQLATRTETLLLADLQAKNEAGERLLAAAIHLIAQLALPKTDRIALQDVRAFQANYQKTLANGDGVLPPEVLPYPAVAQAARDIMATVGGRADYGGMQGIGVAEVDRFVAEGQKWLDWQVRGVQDKTVRPWGDATDEAFALLARLAAKVSAFFWACDLIRQEPRLQHLPPLTSDEALGLVAQNSQEIQKFLADGPLSPPTADASLPLTGQVNPFYSADLEQLQAVAFRVFNAETSHLTRKVWHALTDHFAAYAAWLGDKPAEPFDRLGTERVAQIVHGNEVQQIREHAAIDAAAEAEVQQVAQLEKLILYQRWLVELTNNFVNFSAFYDHEHQALIDTGFLVIDGRRLEFCIRVRNREAHKLIAAESLLFLVYVAVTEKDGTEPICELVSPVTSGERGRMRIGKRGLFIDPRGKEWDATIVDIVENPISILEAIKAPFWRLWAFATKKIHELAVNHLAETTKPPAPPAAAAAPAPATPADATKSATVAPKPVAAIAAAEPDKPAPKPSGSGMQGLLVGGGIAFAALGSTLAYVVSALSSVHPINALRAVLAIIAIVAGISAFFGWLKLRRRDMSLLLEANGWAVNVNMKITRRIGLFFTNIPDLPKNTEIEHLDLLTPLKRPIEPQRGRALWIALLLLIAALAGGLIWARMTDRL